MNDKPKADVIGLDDMLELKIGDPNASPEQQQLSERTFFLVNLIGTTLAPMRQAHGPEHDSPLMAALVTLAGGVYGELLAMGIAPDMTEEASRAMLVNNWRVGVQAGKAKVERIAAEQGVDPTTGRPPEPHPDPVERGK